jgi:carboxyl-terminal processing protease
LLAGILLFAPRLFPQADAPADEVLQEGAKFAQVYGAVEQNYMDALDPDRTIWDGGIRGMLSRLDPFSAFFDREQFELLQQQTRGEALGFGSILYVQPGKVLILQTAEGSPSWRAGLGPGDEIVSVNGTRVDRLDFQSLIELLQRSRSQPVSLGVVPSGKVVTQDFKLQPAEVALPTVDKAFEFSPRIAYLHLSGFEQKTTQEVVDALARLGGPDFSKLKGLLLDLRDNHGGMLDAAIGVASLFLKPNLLLLTVRGRSMPEKTSRSVPTAAHYDGALIVLVNGNTASAAEIVAAALQEHDRAVIVGEPTFGKGVVESVVALSERTGLALTTAQYFTPSGRSIQRPLPGTALAVTQVRLDSASSSASAPAFHTDNGRPVSAAGGVTPDVEVTSRSLDPWAMFLNQRGLFTTFASDYLTLHGRVDPSFEPAPKTLDDFKDFLRRAQVRAPEEYWNQDQAYLKLRIKTEVFNLAFGLRRGDEAEVRGDPQVQKAATLFPRVSQILKPPAPKPGTIHVRRVARLWK